MQKRQYLLKNHVNKRAIHIFHKNGNNWKNVKKGLKTTRLKKSQINTQIATLKNDPQIDKKRGG